MSAGFDSSRSVAEDSGVVGGSLGPQGGAAGASTGGTGRGVGGSGAGGSGRADEPADLSSIATDIAGTAAEKGRVLLDSAKGQAASFADQRKDSAAQSIAAIASTLRDTGGGFEDRPSLKAFVGSAADGLEQLSSSLQERSFADIYGEVEGYARRQPVVFGAAAAFAGFLLARFIKSSAEEMSEMGNARGGSRTARATSSARRV